MADSDIFLKIDGLEGESKDAKHKGEIDIDGFEIQVRQPKSPPTGSGSGAGRAVFGDFHFQLQFSKASPKLFLACATGKHFEKAIVSCRKAGGTQEEFLKITMTEVVVRRIERQVEAESASRTVHSNKPELVERFALRYSRIEQEYRSQKPDGSMDAWVKVGYDVKARQKV